MVSFNCSHLCFIFSSLLSFHFWSCLMCAHELRASQFTANERYHFIFSHQISRSHILIHPPSLFHSHSSACVCRWCDAIQDGLLFLAKIVKTKSSVHDFWTVTTVAVLIRHFYHGKLSEWFVTSYKTKSQIRNTVLPTASVDSDATESVANRKLNRMWPKITNRLVVARKTLVKFTSFVSFASLQSSMLQVNARLWLCASSLSISFRFPLMCQSKASNASK